MILSFEVIMLKNSPEFWFLYPPMAVKFVEKTKPLTSKGWATASAGLQNHCLDGR
jgi:hypothetical protein